MSHAMRQTARGSGDGGVFERNTSQLGLRVRGYQTKLMVHPFQPTASEVHGVPILHVGGCPATYFNAHALETAVAWAAYVRSFLQQQRFLCPSAQLRKLRGCGSHVASLYPSSAMIFQ